MIKGTYTKLAMVLALAVGGVFAFWTVASADSPTPPGASSLPSDHAYYKIFEAKYRVHDTRLESCLVCHTTDEVTGDINGLNPYGDDLATEVGGVYGNAAIEETDDHVIWDALGTIEDTDSDTDGDDNIDEIQTLSFPGDVDDYAQRVPAPLVGGPHGGYLSLSSVSYAPFQCATCHRTHTARAPMLLTDELWTGTSGLCYTCHSGTGALTDIEDGVISIGGDVGSPIHGGGFVNAKMDTDVDETENPQSASVTSTHSVDRTAGLMWGSTASTQHGTGAGKIDVELECGSCHDPHAVAIGYGENPLDETPPEVVLNYRMLQPKPGPAGLSRYAPMLSVPDGGMSGGSYVQDYYDAGIVGTAQTVSRPDTRYQPNDRLVDWCALCHTRYQRVSVGYDMTGSVDSGDPIFAYGHATSEATCSTVRCHTSGGTPPSASHSPAAAFSRPRCLDCHVSHGTISEQTGFGKTTDNCARAECHGETITPLVVDGKIEMTDTPPSWHKCNDCHGPGGPPTGASVFFPGPKHVEWPGFAGQILPPDGTDFGSGQPGEWQERTSLLRSDNRGVCTVCHQK